MWNRLRVLVMLQLGNKYSLSKIHDKKKFAVSLIVLVAIFVAVTIVVMALLKIMGGIMAIPISKELFVLVITVFYVFSIVSCTMGLLKTLYDSKDNALLMSYPARHNEIFVSKILVFYIYEFLKSLCFVIPFLLGYGIFLKMGVSYFVGMFFFIILMPLFPVLVGALLSIPVMLIVNFLSSRPIASVIVLLSVVSLVFVGVILLVNSLPDNIRLLEMYHMFMKGLTDFLRAFTKYSFFFKNIADLMYGSKLLFSYFILIATTLGLFLAVFLITMPVYLKLCSSTRERPDKHKYNGENKELGSNFGTFLVKEIKLITRSSGRLVSNVAYLVIMPFLLYALNRILFSFDISELGQQMTVTVDVLIGLLLILSSNGASATAVSSEGSEFYLLKTAPSPTYQMAWAKILIHLALSTIVISAGCISLGVTTDLSAMEVFAMFSIFVLVNFGHTLWSFEIDMLSPRLHDFAENDGNVDNPNTSKSVVIGLILALLFAALTFILVSPTNVIGLVKLELILIFFALSRLWLFTGRLKVYFERITY